MKKVFSLFYLAKPKLFLNFASRKTIICMNNKEYDILEEERQMASEPATISIVMDSRSDISRAITGEELLNRLIPRIQSLFI